MISGSRDKTLLIWKLTRDVGSAYGIQHRRLEGHNATVQDIACSRDNESVVSASWDNTLRLWDIETAQTIRRFKGHENAVMSVAVSDDNRVILSGSMDKTIRAWNRDADLRANITNGGHTEAVSCVRSSNGMDGDSMVSSSQDKVVKVWRNNGDSYDLSYDLYGHKEGVNVVVVSKDGSVCVSGGRDGRIILWNMSNKSGKHRVLNCGADVTTLALDENGHLLACGTPNGVKIWSLDEMTIIDELHPELPHKSGSKPLACKSVAWFDNGRTLFAGYDDGAIRVWQVNTE